MPTLWRGQTPLYVAERPHPPAPRKWPSRHPQAGRIFAPADDAQRSTSSRSLARRRLDSPPLKTSLAESWPGLDLQSPPCRLSPGPVTLPQSFPGRGTRPQWHDRFGCGHRAKRTRRETGGIKYERRGAILTTANGGTRERLSGSPSSIRYSASTAGYVIYVTGAPSPGKNRINVQDS
jgi:hypothetical protein